MLGATPVGEQGVTAGKDATAIASAEGRAAELGRTLADAVATKRSYPEIDQFHRWYQEKFAEIIAADTEKFATVIKISGAKAE